MPTQQEHLQQQQQEHLRPATSRGATHNAISNGTNNIARTETHQTTHKTNATMQTMSSQRSPRSERDMGGSHFDGAYVHGAQFIHKALADDGLLGAQPSQRTTDAHNRKTDGA